MYKKILQNIHLRPALEENLISSIYKSEQKPSIKDLKPHFIFSVENPSHPDKQRIKMNHDQALEFLKDKGYQAEGVNSFYGSPERSILIHNVQPNQIPHLQKLAANAGQDSSIYSDGYNHEMHFHHGTNAGKFIKGTGTHIHKKKPKDNFTETSDGTIFSHTFDFDKQHDNNQSLIKKNENEYAVIFKNENGNSSHPLKYPEASTKLIHFSPHENLQEIDPRHQGIRGIGSESKQGRPVHPTSFFYLDGSEPERVVMSGVKRKYVSSLGNKNVYDLGKDHLNVFGQAHQQSLSNRINPGVVDRESIDKLIKDNGFHGFYNSKAGSMSNVVAMYDPMPVHQSYEIHPDDYKMASAKNHHEISNQKAAAKQFAEQNGHPNHKFLHGLLGDEND